MIGNDNLSQEITASVVKSEDVTEYKVTVKSEEETNQRTSARKRNHVFYSEDEYTRKKFFATVEDAEVDYVKSMESFFKSQKEKQASRKPRPVSSNQFGDHLGLIKRIREDDVSSRINRMKFLARHFDVIKPFVTHKMEEEMKVSLPICNSYTKTEIAKFEKIDRFSVSSPPQCVKEVSMRDYQIEGLKFMLKMEENGMSCILADEMGLGKTLQTIAFLGSLKNDFNKPGPHLIVVPLSVINNWMSEIKRFCPSLKALRYHSASADIKKTLRDFASKETKNGNLDIIVTTYEMLVAEKAHGIANLRYRYLVLDEAHKCKNEAALVSLACRRVTCNNRLLLTGTPMQNNLHECWALLHLLQSDVFSKPDVFDGAFDAADMTTCNLSVIDAVSILLKLLVLRRQKGDINLMLPPKRELRLMCPLSEMQTFWYKRLLLTNAHHILSDHDGNVDSAANLFSDNSSTSQGTTTPTVSKSKMNISNIVMQLRKISNHPYLFSHIEEDPGSTTLGDLTETSGKLKMLDHLIETLISEGHRMVIFSQFTSMLDLIEDYLTMQGKYKYLRIDGSTNRIRRRVNIKLFNSLNSNFPIFLLSTRAGGLGVNLQTADTCILYDSDWNPQSDLQAMARIHRIGQTKNVTCYRLVSSGTIEERMVARAHRKLILDQMVIKGTDEILRTDSSPPGKSKGGNLKNRMNYNKDVSESDMAEALKFTMKRMFTLSGGRVVKCPLGENENNDQLSFDNLARLLNEARNEDSGKDDDSDSDNNNNQNNDINKNNNSNNDKVINNTNTVDDNNGDYSNSNSNNIDNSNNNNNNNDDDDDCFALKSESNCRKFAGQDYSDLSKIYTGKTKKDILKEWKEKKLADNLAKTKQRRQSQSRFIKVGQNGKNEILVSREDYANGKNEQSDIYIKNGEVYQTADLDLLPMKKDQTRKQLRAGVDYDNIDHCQACGEDGDVVCCDNCPMSFHLHCLGYKNMRELEKDSPIKGIFRCPHHHCSKCSKGTTQSGGCMLRCLGCQAAYCEDCLDWDDDDVEIIETQPPQLLQHLGYTEKMNKQSIYVNCSAQCAFSSKQVDDNLLPKQKA